MYASVYDELFQRVPSHSQLVEAQNPDARKPVIDAQLRTIQPFLSREMTFLEVGCGDGALSCRVAEHVKQVYALEVSKHVVRIPEGIPNLQVKLFDGFCIPLSTGSVDLAYSNQVMEHLHPDDAFEELGEIYRVLAPGAKYICITPNRLGGPFDVSRDFDDVATGLHLHEYTVAELVRLFRSVGFRRVRVFLSYEGKVLSPLLPVTLFTAFERAFAKLPSRRRKSLGMLLLAIKVVASK